MFYEIFARTTLISQDSCNQENSCLKILEIICQKLVEKMYLKVN